MNQLAHVLYASAPPATSSLSGMIVGLLPSRDTASVELAVKAAASGRIYDCKVPLALAGLTDLRVGAAVEIVGVEVAPQHLRVLEVAIFS